MYKKNICVLSKLKQNHLSLSELGPVILKPN